MTEIIIFAMVALFVGLRLYSVLGQRTGHEQQPMADMADAAPLPKVGLPPETRDASGNADQGFLGHIGPSAIDGLRAIVSADSRFDSGHFLEGARAAYGMILDAFWRGDERALAELANADVCHSFSEAIRAREADGLTLDNRLVRIDRAVIEGATIENRIARITVHFEADIAGVTRDRDGNIVAGSLSDAVPTHDLWTFSRNVRDSDPNWMLVETDEAA
ncbi:Tim44/TimA family putative adaptor protein [Aquisediminimonas sediminicola]|uniref:Tim44/TimA family putative adaptor protein n=1 Tax=Alteraquisediminimonas sediminicola TaxID=2676787 RepID=UPI001C8DFE92